MTTRPHTDYTPGQTGSLSASLRTEESIEELRRRLCPGKHHHLYQACDGVLGTGNNKITKVGNGSEGMPCRETADHATELCFDCSLPYRRPKPRKEPRMSLAKKAYESARKPRAPRAETDQPRTAQEESTVPSKTKTAKTTPQPKAEKQPKAATAPETRPAAAIPPAEAEQLRADPCPDRRPALRPALGPFLPLSGGVFMT